MQYNWYNDSPMSKFNGGLTKPPLKFGHGWVITSMLLSGCNYISMHESKLRFSSFLWVKVAPRWIIDSNDSLALGLRQVHVHVSLPDHCWIIQIITITSDMAAILIQMAFTVWRKTYFVLLECFRSFNINQTARCWVIFVDRVSYVYQCFII